MQRSEARNAAGDIEALLEYWFDVDTADARSMQKQSRRWFMSGPDEDRALAGHFGGLARDAAEGRLDSAAATPRGRLALILLLDQLPRNLYRGTPAAFAQDAKALALCREGLENGHALALTPLERVFFCMPLQHAESIEMQDLSVETFAELADAESDGPVADALRNFAEYAKMHRDIVARFGRFPHRNAILGRHSVAAEAEFLASGGPSFGQ